MHNSTIAISNNEIIGREARDLRPLAAAPTPEGAKAILETFYHAFNQQSLTVFDDVWAPDPLIQLNNPLGGIQRGHTLIQELYRRIFEGPAQVWVEFYDIIAYYGQETAVFAGRERGEFIFNGAITPLNIRTTRVFRYLGAEMGWRQIHHHGSIDDPELLKQYQTAVKGK